jgi:CheY-like chemotaxis protein
MNIMIVDDSARMRTVIREIVCRPGDSVTECSDGTEAVSEYLRSLHDPPVYIFMDIELKVMDGFTAAEQILRVNPHARIIVVTNHNTSAFRLKAKQLKISGFVLKDDLQQLARIIIRPA